MAFRVIRDARPGLLDPTQPARVLQNLSATLIFAEFDSGTTAGGHGQYSPNKRIVVEIPPHGGGPCRWRYVPNARLSPGVTDEGTWPRIVAICK